jgi:signal peptidase I
MDGIWFKFMNLDMEMKLLVVSAIVFVISRFTKKWKNAETKDEKQKRRFVVMHEWAETIWSAVLIAAFIMYFIIQAFEIPSGSMRMTLLEGDHLFVNKFIYGIHVPLSGGRRILPLRSVKQKDIVVFRAPQRALSPLERERGVRKDFIKRCMAFSGDVVEVKNKKLYINGKAVEEPYVSYATREVYPPVKVFANAQQYQRAWEAGQFAYLSSDVVRDNFGPVVVPAGHYFVMGDNRDQSFDSRYWGPLPDNMLKGNPLVLYWPLPRARLIR